MPTIVQFGAGNIGRGFVGQLFCEAGRETVFVEGAPELAAALNERRSYPPRLVGPGPHGTVTAGPGGAGSASDAEAVARELAAAEFACTAVGVAALPHVAAPLAAGLRRRVQQGGGPLNVLLCENQLHCADLLRGLVEREFSIAECGVR